MFWIIITWRASFYIDGEKVWDGGSYDPLSNGDGESVDEKFYAFLVHALGVLDAADEPSCKVTIGDYTNLGIGDTESGASPGVSGKSMDCVHDLEGDYC